MIDNVISSKLLLQTDFDSNTLQLSNSKASIIPNKKDVKKSFKIQIHVPSFSKFIITCTKPQKKKPFIQIQTNMI